MSLVCPLGTIDHGLADQLDITWGDPDAWTAEGLHWTHLPQVRAAINRKVSGAAEVSPLRWFFQAVAAEQPLPLNRVLVRMRQRHAGAGNRPGWLGARDRGD